MYIDPLLKEINTSKVGCYVGDIACNAFAYADDIALLSPTKQGLNQLIKICETFSLNYSIKFNSSKSRLIVFSNDPNKNFKDLNMKLNGQMISVFNEINHLGFTINNSRSFYNISGTINDIKVRTNVINSNFRYFDTESKVRILMDFEF